MDSYLYIFSLYEDNLINNKRTFQRKIKRKTKKKHTLNNVRSSFVQIMIFEFLPKKRIFEISFGSKYLYHNLKLKNMYKKYYQSLRKLKEYESPNIDIFSYYTNEELSNQNIYYFDILSEIVKIMEKNPKNIYEIPYNHLIFEKLNKENKINNYKIFINAQNLLDEGNKKHLKNKNIELRCKSKNDLDLLLKEKLMLNNLIINLNLQFDFEKCNIDIFNQINFPNLKSLILMNEGKISKIIFDENIFKNLQKFQIFNIYIVVNIEKGVEFENIIELFMENSDISFDSPIQVSKKIKTLILRNCGMKINNILLNLKNFKNLSILNIENLFSKLNISSLSISELMNNKNECIQQFIQKLNNKSRKKKEYQFFFEYNTDDKIKKK